MKTILVALDLSQRSAAVLKAASQLAEKQDARLLIVHVVAPVVGRDLEIAGVATGALTDRLTTMAQAELHALEKLVPERVKRETRVLKGFPWQTICATASSENVDLVVIGAHGYTLLDRMLGTTATRILNHLDRPVFVVRGSTASAA